MVILVLMAALLVATVAAFVTYRRVRASRPSIRILLGLGAFGLAFIGICAAFVGAFLVSLFEPWPLFSSPGS